MKLRFQQLETHLNKTLAPIYLLSGDEPLQLMEAADAVRARARAAGYGDRQVFEAGPGFDWQQLTAAGDHLSLFADKRLFDLRLFGKPDAAGAKVLAHYAEDPPPDTLLLIQTGKLDKGVAASAWVKKIERAGVLLQVWPLSADETGQWIVARAQRLGLVPDRDAVRLLVERVEGNLLAAAQEIDKLALLCGQGPVDADAVLAAVADSARFTVFDLADAALAGEAGRAAHVLEGLRAEGAKPLLVLWALSREVRALTGMADALGQGNSLQQVTRSVWQRRRPLVEKALRRGDGAQWPALLRRCAYADRLLKGQTAESASEGRYWDELLQLTLSMCGRSLFTRVCRT